MTVFNKKKCITKHVLPAKVRCSLAVFIFDMRNSFQTGKLCLKIDEIKYFYSRSKET